MKITWKIFKRFIDILQSIAVIIGIIIAITTLEDNRKIESAKFAHEINRDLDSKKYALVYFTGLTLNVVNHLFSLPVAFFITRNPLSSRCNS